MDHVVFICHSTRDADVANDLCARLEQRGVACWIAPRDVPPSEEFYDVIPPAIRQARLILAVISSRVFKGSHVPRELALALKDETTAILPYRIEDVALPDRFDYLLGTHQWIDAFLCKPAVAADYAANYISSTLGKSASVDRPACFGGGKVSPHLIQASTQLRPSGRRKLLLALAVLAAVAWVGLGLDGTDKPEEPPTPAVDRSTIVFPGEPPFVIQDETFDVTVHDIRESAFFDSNEGTCRVDQPSKMSRWIDYEFDPEQATLTIHLEGYSDRAFGLDPGLTHRGLLRSIGKEGMGGFLWQLDDGSILTFIRRG